MYGSKCWHTICSHSLGTYPWKTNATFFYSLLSDVPLWLKSLRLHKYAYLFQLMTYEDMMNLTEEWLEVQVNYTRHFYHCYSFIHLSLWATVNMQVILYACFFIGSVHSDFTPSNQMAVKREMNINTLE